MGSHQAQGRVSYGPRIHSRAGHAVATMGVRTGVAGGLAAATIALPLAHAVATPAATGAAPQALLGNSAPAAVPVAARAASLPAVAVTPGTVSFTSDSVKSSLAAQAGTVIRTAPEEADQGVSVTATIPALAAARSLAGPFTKPAGDAAISSPFGFRIHPTHGTTKLHEGIDYAATCGSSAVSAAAGTVIEVSRTSSSGNRVLVAHGADAEGHQIVTGYYHLLSQSVAVGDDVQAGQEVGKVGSTGDSTGCHLHFALAVDGAYTDPAQLFE